MTYVDLHRFNLLLLWFNRRLTIFLYSKPYRHIKLNGGGYSDA
jgi:hypothetical protein